jgi:hypothetical protein
VLSAPAGHGPEPRSLSHDPSYVTTLAFPKKTVTDRSLNGDVTKLMGAETNAQMAAIVQETSFKKRQQPRGANDKTNRRNENIKRNKRI